MPSPGRQNQSSALAKRNPKLLAHAAIMEYDVVLAEHAFHEMRLNAIAAGRSVSQATSQGPTRTLSRSTPYSQRHEGLMQERQLDAHHRALEEIKHRAPQELLPPLSGPSNAPHRHEVAKGLDVDNFALGHRLETVRGSAPTVEACLAAERKREEIVNRLRTVKGPGVKQRPLPPEKVDEMERNWYVRATPASVPGQVVPLPPIVDNKGHHYETPRGPPHTARPAAHHETEKGSHPPSSSQPATARVRMPPKPPKLPVKPRARPAQTLVPLSMALKFNPRNTGATVEELQSRARGSVESEEDTQRHTIGNDEAAARNTLESDHQHGLADADRRRARREELEKEHLAEREDFIAEEESYRQPLEEDEAHDWAQLLSAAAKGAQEAEEAHKQRLERERLKTKRRFEALDAEENRSREAIASDEESGFAHIKKQWRKMVSDAEESAALQLRSAAVEKALPSDRSACELVPSAPLEPQRANWRSLPRVVRSADGSSQVRVANTRTDAVVGGDTLPFVVLPLSESYVALALEGAPSSPSSSTASPRLVLAADGPNAAATFITVNDEALQAKNGVHVFELRLADEASAGGGRARFFILSKSKPGHALKHKAGGLILAPHKTTDESQLFCTLSLADAAADEDRYAQDALAAEEAAEIAHRKKLADARRVAAESVVPGNKIDPAAVYELCLADDTQVRINRSSADDRAKLRAGERWGSTLDQYCLRLDDDGYVSFVAPDNTAWGITSPGKGQATVGLRFEALAGKEDAGAFEVEAVPPLNDADSDRRFFLRPKLCPEMVVEAKVDSEARRVILVPEADASNLGEFLLQPLEQVQQQFHELEQQKREAEAAEIENRMAAIEAAFDGRPDPKVLYEMAVADDPTVRITRSGGKVVVGARANSTLDQFFVHVDDRGYITLVSNAEEGQGDAVCFVSSGAKGKGTFTFAPKQSDSTLFELEAVPLSSSQAQDGRFYLRPKTHPNFVLEVDVERGVLTLMKEDNASNLGEFLMVLHSVAQQHADTEQAELRAAISEEAMQARCDALEAIVGDPEQMIVYDIVPLHAPELRLAVTDEKAGTLAIEAIRDTEAQQFVFADVGEGYINLVPWSTPQAAVTASLRDGTCVVLEGNAATEGQQFEIVRVRRDGEEGAFTLVPRDAPTKHLAVDLDAMVIRLVESADDDPMCAFKLVQREPSPDLMSDSGAPLSDHSGDFKRRTETLMAICGSIMENVDVIEFFPADTPRLRLGAHTTADAAVTGDKVVLRSRKGTSLEQFTVVDAGDGYVHLVPWSDPTLALWVDDDMTTVSFKPAEVGHKMCCFELAQVDKSPRSPKKGIRAKFFIVPKVLPHCVLDITDDETAPLALMPDSALSPMAEMSLIKHEDANAEQMERSTQRRQSKLDATAKARREAAISIFGPGYQTTRVAPVDDPDRRLLAQLPVDGVTALSIADASVHGALPPAHAEVHIVPVPAGYVALRFDLDGKHYLVSLQGETTQLLEIEFADIEDATKMPDTAHFEVFILDEPGCFCLGPKTREGCFIEAQLNEDGRFCLIAEKDASSFAEMRVIPPA